MQKPPVTATWDETADRWETGEVDIFGHSAAFSVTLPKSGMTRSGRLYERPTSVPPTTAPESFLSPGRPAVFSTPDTMPDAPNSGSNMKTRPAGLGNQVKALPVPMTSDDRTTSAADMARKSPPLRSVGKHFPTPKAGDGIMGRPRTTGRPIEKSTHLGTIVTLLPTPGAAMATRGPSKEVGGSRPSGQPRQVDLNTVVVRKMSTPTTPVEKHFPTPSARDGTSGSGQSPAKRRAGGHSVNLTDAITELPSGESTPPLFGGGSA